MNCDRLRLNLPFFKEKELFGQCILAQQADIQGGIAWGGGPGGVFAEVIDIGRLDLGLSLVAGPKAGSGLEGTE